MWIDASAALANLGDGQKVEVPPATPATFLNVPQFDTHPDDAPIQPDVRHFGPQKIEVLAPEFEDLSYLCDLYSDDISATGRFTDLHLNHWCRSKEFYPSTCAKYAISR